MSNSPGVGVQTRQPSHDQPPTRLSCQRLERTRRGDSVPKTLCHTVETISFLPPSTRGSSTCVRSKHTLWPSPRWGGLLQLVEPQALSLVVFAVDRPCCIHLPGTLRSTGVTRFRRYYGSSDSCWAALRIHTADLHRSLDCPSRTMNTGCIPTGLLASLTESSHHSVSNHLITSPKTWVGFRLRGLPPQKWSSFCTHWAGFRSTSLGLHH